MNKITVEYDLSLAMVEGKIRDKLIEMGWTPPSFEEPKKVELEGGMYRFQMDGQVFLGEGRYKYGDTRQTEELAQLAAKRMLRVNRLSALASQLGGEKEFVEGNSNWYIYLDESWYILDAKHKYDPEKVYMTKECAEQIANLLNKGLFDLNGDE